jgi:hypothetical protein
VADKSELEITIGADGVVRVVTHGLKGQTCMTETKDLEVSLGTVRTREKTREFHEQKERGTTGVKTR